MDKEDVLILGEGLALLLTLVFMYYGFIFLLSFGR
jgi:hypothetical protein